MFCKNCGAEIDDNAVVCVNCGCAVEKSYNKDENSTLITVIKVFMIIGCVSTGFALIPLAWSIPLTVIAFKRMNNGEPIGIGIKITTLILINLVAGICMLCLKDEN